MRICRGSSPRLPVALSAAVALVLAVAAPAPAASLPADTTAVISGTPDLLGLLATPVDDAQASEQAVDRDGGRVVFDSTSDGLLAGTDNDVRNVYVKDMVSGAVTLVSVAPDGSPSHVFCHGGVISDDGTHVAFVCSGPLDPADTSGHAQIYERDLTTSRTVLVSRASGLGAVANSDASDPSIDASGAHVAFQSSATNLDPAATSGAANVYRRSVGTEGDGTVVVDRATNNSVAARGAFSPSIDNAGDRVAFESLSALDPVHDPNGGLQIYVRDLSAGTTTIASRASDAAGAAAADGAAEEPAISGNGTVVAFRSEADNLDPHETVAESQVYRHSLTTGTTQLISATADGTKAMHGDVRTPAIDDSGSVIGFESDADNLLGPGSAAPPVEAYVRTVGPPDALVLASRGDGAAGEPSTGGTTSDALSPDGHSVALTVRAPMTSDIQTPNVGSVALRSLSAATTRTVSRPPGSALFANAGGESSGGSVSADGRFVAFVSTAPALGTPADTEGAVLVRDVVTGAVTLAGREDGVSGAPIHAEDAVPAISADGRRVAFAGIGAEGEQVYVRDLATNRTVIASRADGADGALSDGNVDGVSISDDGSRVAFSSDATNLGDGDTDDETDVHVRDIDAGRTILISRADGVSGVKGNGPSEDPLISGDGRRVAFDSEATNLAAGDTDATDDVFVRTIDGGTTQLASVTGAATKGNDSSFAQAISRDGNRIAFVSFATNFDATAGEQLYVRDLAQRTLTLASRADGPNGTPIAGNVRSGALSADGTTVAFSANPPASSAPGDSGSGLRVFARNLATGVTRLVSRATGPNGAGAQNGNEGVATGGITADGGCVTFTAAPGDLLPPPASDDFGQVFVRVFEPDCGRPPLAVAGADAGPVTAPPVLTPAPARDRTAPRLTHVRLSHTRFRVRAKATTLSLTVSEAATLTVTVDRERPGRRGGTKKHPTCRVVAKAPKKGACVGLSRDGVLRHVVEKAGAVKIVFSGKIGRKRLAVGRHRMIVVARDKAANASKPVTVRFTVVR